MNRLIASMCQARKTTETFTVQGGIAYSPSPNGGCILGLFQKGNDENFLWTKPALSRADNARAFFASNEWCNIGSDRGWLALEKDLFCLKYPFSSLYFQSRLLDPRRYTCKRTVKGAPPGVQSATLFLPHRRVCGAIGR